MLATPTAGRSFTNERRSIPAFCSSRDNCFCACDFLFMVSRKVRRSIFAATLIFADAMSYPCKSVEAVSSAVNSFPTKRYPRTPIEHGLQLIGRICTVPRRFAGWSKSDSFQRDDYATDDPCSSTRFPSSSPISASGRDTTARFLRTQRERGTSSHHHHPTRLHLRGPSRPSIGLPNPRRKELLKAGR